jgi:hypothetical protein
MASAGSRRLILLGLAPDRGFLVTIANGRATAVAVAD